MRNIYNNLIKEITKINGNLHSYTTDVEGDAFYIEDPDLQIVAYECSKALDHLWNALSILNRTIEDCIDE